MNKHLLLALLCLPLIPACTASADANSTQSSVQLKRFEVASIVEDYPVQLPQTFPVPNSSQILAVDYCLPTPNEPYWCSASIGGQNASILHDDVLGAVLEITPQNPDGFTPRITRVTIAY